MGNTGMACNVFTIAICTWNRSASLRTTLENLRNLSIPPGIDWEVLIVNNNCTDDTDEVVERFVGLLPIRLLHEAQQGLSKARNCAVAGARGDYILWTDDDTIVDRDWLAAYVDAVRAWPEAALFAGPIKLKLEGTPPDWLAEGLNHESIASCYAHRNASDVPIRLSSEHEASIPYGPNFCIRAREQRRFLYRTELGKRGNTNVRSEETDVARSVLESGAEGWWVPAAIVHHVIPQDFLTRSYLRSCFVGAGRSLVRCDVRPGHRAVLRAPELFAAAMYSELRYRLQHLLRKPARLWLEHFKMASIRWGTLLELLQTFSSSLVRRG